MRGATAAKVGGGGKGKGEGGGGGVAAGVAGATEREDDARNMGRAGSGEQ